MNFWVFPATLEGKHGTVSSTIPFHEEKEGRREQSEAKRIPSEQECPRAVSQAQVIRLLHLQSKSCAMKNLLVPISARLRNQDVDPLTIHKWPGQRKSNPRTSFLQPSFLSPARLYVVTLIVTTKACGSACHTHGVLAHPGWEPGLCSAWSRRVPAQRLAERPRAHEDRKEDEAGPEVGRDGLPRQPRSTALCAARPPATGTGCCCQRRRAAKGTRQRPLSPSPAEPRVCYWRSAPPPPPPGASLPPRPQQPCGESSASTLPPHPVADGAVAARSRGPSPAPPRRIRGRRPPHRARAERGRGHRPKSPAASDHSLASPALEGKLARRPLVTLPTKPPRGSWRILWLWRPQQPCTWA
nr:uncharacterized protein LOC103350941 [Oryctolagus cuniculus]